MSYILTKKLAVKWFLLINQLIAKENLMFWTYNKDNSVVDEYVAQEGNNKVVVTMGSFDEYTIKIIENVSNNDAVRYDVVRYVATGTTRYVSDVKELAEKLLKFHTTNSLY